MKPLEGIRVLDLSRLLPGPFASMVLADLGASVDKLEDPKGGDYTRVMPPQHEGMNTAFHLLNRGKRSLVLDLKKEEGRDAFRKLVPRYDVVLESFRPGVMARFGLGYEALKALHPGLVYCAITGYGQDGPLAQRAGHDLNYLARAGVLGFTGPKDAPPQVPGVQLADVGGGALYGVIGILAALQARATTGEGRFVDIAMCEGALSFGLFGFASRFGGLRFPRGEEILMGGIAPYRCYETSDGRHVSLASLEPKFWIAFCQGVGIQPDLQALAPGPHQARIGAELTKIFRSKTLAEWSAFADEVDCCLEPVLTPEEARSEPQHVARGVFVERAGLPHIRTPVAAPAEGPAPKQGADTNAILKDAGFDDEAIAALRDAGACR